MLHAPSTLQEILSNYNVLLQGGRGCLFGQSALLEGEWQCRKETPCDASFAGTAAAGRVQVQPDCASEESPGARTRIRTQSSEIRVQLSSCQ